MTTRTQATLSASKAPHQHVWQIDFENPTRSTCSCGKVRQHKSVGWGGLREASKRTAARRKAKRPAGDGAKPKRTWHWGVKG